MTLYHSITVIKTLRKLKKQSWKLQFLSPQMKAESDKVYHLVSYT